MRNTVKFKLFFIDEFIIRMKSLNAAEMQSFLHTKTLKPVFISHFTKMHSNLHNDFPGPLFIADIARKSSHNRHSVCFKFKVRQRPHKVSSSHSQKKTFAFFWCVFIRHFLHRKKRVVYAVVLFQLFLIIFDVLFSYL